MNEFIFNLIIVMVGLVLTGLVIIHFKTKLMVLKYELTEDIKDIYTPTAGLMHQKPVDKNTEEKETDPS